MDNLHPIPQNVTSFQFKLIGDMTLKQFAYLAAGSASAYITFVFFAHDFPLVAWPLTIIFALLGAAFAFLPIESRPLDHWLRAFLKAIYSPTKRAWGKNGKSFKEDPLFGSRLVMYLAGAQPSSVNQYISTSVGQKISGSETPTPRLAEPLPTPEQLGKTVDLAREAQQLQMKIIQTERTLSQMKDQAQKPTPIPIDYSQQVNRTLTQLQNLVTQASQVKQQIQTIQEPESQIPTAPPLSPRTKVKVVIPPKPERTQVALTTFPNVINGIVKDTQENFLEGVVVVIYDKDGLPVRALKTNKLGQFTGSTPLANGAYTLEIEKDNFSFDVLQIELTGEVLPPLQITSKG